MPDHAQILITLGPRLSLGRTLQRLKARTSAVLRRHELRWERDFSTASCDLTMTAFQSFGIFTSTPIVQAWQQEKNNGRTTIAAKRIGAGLVRVLTKIFRHPNGLSDSLQVMTALPNF